MPSSKGVNGGYEEILTMWVSACRLQESPRICLIICSNWKHSLCLGVVAILYITRKTWGGKIGVNFLGRSVKNCDNLLCIKGPL